MAVTKKSAKSATPDEGFSSDERSAIKERAQELRAAKLRATQEDDAKAVVEKIDTFSDHDRALAKKLHAIIAENASDLTPKLWYGMPAYAKDGKIVCFFQDARKFKTRYATFGFNDSAQLDEGDLWPVAYALQELTPAVEKKIVALVRKAAR